MKNTEIIDKYSKLISKCRNKELREILEIRFISMKQR